MSEDRTASEILSTSDLARLLDLPNTRAARRLLAREGIPRIVLGRRTYVLYASLLVYLKQKEKVPATSDGGARVLRGIRKRKRAVTTSVLNQRRKGC